MKRRWDVIQNILEHIEAEDLYSSMKSHKYIDELGIDEDEYLGHVALLDDAEIIKNCDITRDVNGGILFCNVNGAYVTMEGHDLLDALRDKPVWSKIKMMAMKAGVSLSWQFIKAAIPIAIKDLLQK